MGSAIPAVERGGARGGGAFSGRDTEQIRYFGRLLLVPGLSTFRENRPRLEADWCWTCAQERFVSSYAGIVRSTEVHVRSTEVGYSSGPESLHPPAPTKPVLLTGGNRGSSLLTAASRICLHSLENAHPGVVVFRGGHRRDPLASQPSYVLLRSIWTWEYCT